MAPWEETKEIEKETEKEMNRLRRHNPVGGRTVYTGDSLPNIDFQAQNCRLLHHP